ncbi:two-component sensor histidine kinase [Camelimonas fluminis]|uniref:histidine kinase n=1 Tax=Camelimonas fluminis TaxID=1576911 RepID=A0ABV7UFT4_9HYPH|nr:ATP-binding protein [Camelimonas fluminis]GHE51573.1 two-component sensor histidine kinase [Camelimonas fluminis]
MNATANPDDLANRQNLLLLIHLRWIAACGQIATILAVHVWLGVRLPLAGMLAVVAFLVCVNLASVWRSRWPGGISSSGLFLELLVDVGALTLQLYLSGGAANPFIFLYLLQLMLGLVLLRAWAVWALVVITSLCFIGLMFFRREIVMPPGEGEAAFFRLHLQGMFLCFLLAAALLAIFVGRIQRNLRARDARLEELRQRSAEEEHIVRIGLLASGAAHELGTPLSTQTVILDDWRHAAAFTGDPGMMEELEEMQEQLDRCKAIVSSILTASGEVRGEGAAHTRLSAFIDNTVGEWASSRKPAHFSFAGLEGGDCPIVTDMALRQMAFNVLDNALEASPQMVRLRVRNSGQELEIEVSDAGPGFSEQMLKALGLPYHSTKGRPGSGLGLFLVSNVVRQLGGRLDAYNRAEGGACVRMTLPLTALTFGPPMNEDVEGRLHGD